MSETGAWMPMYWGDYFGDTMHLTTEEHGAYILLIGTYWRRGGPLPDDDKWLASVTKMHTNRWRVLRNKLAPLFDIKPGVCWTHKRLEKEIVRSNDRLLSARTAGIASGVAKRKRTDQPVTTTVTDREVDKKASTSLIIHQFDDFWSLVPLKRGKGQARKAFKAALKKTDFETLKAGIIRYAREAAGKDDEFIAHPTTWLNGERWLDEPERKPHAKHREPSAHDTLLAAGYWAGHSRDSEWPASAPEPDPGGKGNAGKSTPPVQKLPRAGTTS